MESDLKNQNRIFMFTILHFLLKDLVVLKKRAYLAIYLSSPDIPYDFMQDDGKLKNSLRNCRLP